MENDSTFDPTQHTPPPTSAAEAHAMLEQIDQDSAVLASKTALPWWVHFALGLGASMLVGAPLAHGTVFGFGALVMMLLGLFAALIPHAIASRLQGIEWPRPAGTLSRGLLSTGMSTVAILLLASSALFLSWEGAPWLIFLALAIAAGAITVSYSYRYHEAVHSELAALGASDEAS